MPAEANRDGASLHPGPVEHGLEAYAGPARVAHGTVRPLRAGNTWLKVTARVARALVDCDELHLRQREQFVERQRQRAVDVPVHGQPEAVHVNFVGNTCPVPAHVKLVVRREYRSVEHFHRRFQQRRAGALKNERALLWKGRGDGAFVRPAGQRQLDDVLGNGGQRRQGGRACCGKEAAARRWSWWGKQFVHAQPSKSGLGELVTQLPPTLL
jgi:hypothetical protein